MKYEDEIATCLRNTDSFPLFPDILVFSNVLIEKKLSKMEKKDRPR
jgi:hypothetical protein